MEKLAHKIIRNTFFNSAGRIWFLVLSFFLTPYMVAKLGVEGFGLWSLAFAISGYMALLDLGIAASFTKYIAEYHAKKDYGLLSEVVNTGLLFYLAFGVVIGVLGYLLSPLLASLFHLSISSDEVLFVLLGAFLLLAASNVSSVFHAVLNGLQRMDIVNVITMITSVPYAAGVVAFLHWGFGLRGLIVNSAITWLLTTSLVIVFSFRILPQLKMGTVYITLPALRRLIGYGSKLQFVTLGGMVNLQSDKLFIGYFVGVPLVTFYELGFKVASLVRSLGLLVVAAIVPAAAEVEVARGKESLKQLYLRGAKYMALATVPLASLVVACAPLVMRTWMGEGYELSTWVIGILMAGYLATLLTAMGTMVARGTGRLRYEVGSALLTMSLNLPLSLILALRIGFFGPVIASSFSAIAASIYFTVLFHRYLGISSLRLLRETYLPPVVASAVGATAILLFNYFLGNVQNRIYGLFLLGMDTVFMVGLYAVILLMLRYFDAYDRELTAGALSSLRLRLSRR